MIVDNELNRLMVNPLPPGVRLHVVIGIPPPSPVYRFRIAVAQCILLIFESTQQHEVLKRLD